MNDQSSVHEQHHKNKDNIVIFTPFSEQKIQAQKEAKKQATAVITNIAQTIFERFGCGSSFNDDCIKNFGEMYDPANFKIELLNFQPTKSIFAFMYSIHPDDFLRIGNECIFYTDESALLYKLKVSYRFISLRNSDFIGSYLNVVFNGNFDIESISYSRLNGLKESLVNVSKSKNMLCPVEQETMFIELFLNDHNFDVQNLFPEFYQKGANTFDINELEAKITLARMLII